MKISELSEFADKELQKEIPELPREKRERYRADFGVKDEDIESFIRDKNLADFFEEVVKNFINDKETIKLASNYITSDLMGLMKLNSSENYLGKIVKDAFIQLIQLAKDKKISSRGAKDILAIMFEKGGSPEEIAKDKNLFQQSDEGELQKIIGQVIAENQAVVKEYKNGKETALKYLIGQGMKISRGSANPEKIGELLKKSL